MTFAVTLESLSVAVYERALSLRLTPRIQTLTQRILNQERQHLRLVMQRLKSLSAEPPPDKEWVFTFKDQSSFIKQAQTVEELTISAYDGAIPSLTRQDNVVLLAGIVAAEAGHATALRLARDLQPVPGALDRSYDKQQAERALAAFMPPET